MNWGIKIILSFICFIGLLFALVYISMNQDVSLVAENYYEQELAYEDQIQRIKNSEELPEKLAIKVNRKTSKAELIIPEAVRTLFKEGSVLFFRPSEARLDEEFVMLPGNQGSQLFDLSKFKTGLWKVKVNWSSTDKEFYAEMNIVL